jgi:hypothetical protein
MADKDVGKLEPLFHDKSKFVHMSGTWKKAEELEIIDHGDRPESGRRLEAPRSHLQQRAGHPHDQEVATITSRETSGTCGRAAPWSGGWQG